MTHMSTRCDAAPCGVVPSIVMCIVGAGRLRYLMEGGGGGGASPLVFLAGFC